MCRDDLVRLQNGTVPKTRTAINIYTLRASVSHCIAIQWNNKNLGKPLNQFQFILFIGWLQPETIHAHAHTLTRIDVAIVAINTRTFFTKNVYYLLQSLAESH